MSLRNTNGRQGQPPHVVIVGGGFGGLYAARTLAGYPVRITLIDRENYHLFQPLLYQVATAALSPADIAEPIRFILRRHANIRVVLGEVKRVDLDERSVVLADGRSIGYDAVIVATGSRHAYFGHDEWEPFAPWLKSLEDALEARRQVLSAFEAAEVEMDLATRDALLTFVVVGGGPAGVELAGTIAELRRHTVAGEFRTIDPTQARVFLLEGGPRILPSFPPDLSAAAARGLEAHGVEVRTGALVSGVTPEAVHVGQEVIPTRTVVWAAGVAASPLGRSLGVPLDRSGRVLVEPDLSVPGHPEAYVVGDLAALPDPRTGQPLPGLGAVAIQEGPAAARNVWRTLRGQPRQPFQYRDKGKLAIIGRQAAVAQFGKLHVTGRLALTLWGLVHVFLLIGFQNRALVMMQWIWSYLTYQRGVRLITRPWPFLAPAATQTAQQQVPAAERAAMASD